MNDNKNKKPFYIFLKELRESQEISLQSISDRTKINIEYLKSIEKGNFDVIPPTFLRLFIKSYAKFLKVNHEEILSQYEEEKNITKNNIFKSLVPEFSRNKKTDETRKLSINKDKVLMENDLDNTISKNELNNLKEKVNNSDNEKNIMLKKDEIVDSKTDKLIFEDPNNINSKFNLKETYFFKPRKIFSILFTLIAIISIYLLIHFLNINQKEKIIVSNLENNIIPLENNTNDIIDNKLLSSINFDKSKLIKEKSYKLKFNINSPYIFKIVTNKKTKIYISYDNEEGERKEECNIIARKDSLLKYKKYNNIYFDLWSSNDVQIDIENNSLSKYLGKDDVSVRGSFEPVNKLLHLKFYSR